MSELSVTKNKYERFGPPGSRKMNKYDKKLI